MNPKVRSTLTDDFSYDQACSICGQKNLHVVHLDAYPDYVNCDNCGSAFVVEDGGERVMYGKIPAQYPETRHFALQQWVWPEAIARKAAPERTTGSTGPVAAPPLPPLPEAPAPPSLEPDQPAVEPPAPEPVAEMTTDAESEVEDRPVEAGPAAETAQDEGWDTELASTATPSFETTPAEPEPIDSWPPPPLEADEMQDAAGGDLAGEADQVSADVPEAAADLSGWADEPGIGEEGGEQPTGETLGGPEPPVGVDMTDAAAQEESERGLGDEEDLLDSLWGGEPYPSSEVKTADLPEPPAWATAGQPEGEPSSPPEVDAEAGPQPDDVPSLPTESDQDTANRLHTWGAPEEEEQAAPETPGDDQLGSPSFPWDAAPDEAGESPPPIVAPFEEGDWSDDAFGFPEQPVQPASEPSSASTPGMAPTDQAAGEIGEPDTQPVEAGPKPGAEDAEKAGMAQAYWGGAKGPPPPEEKLPEGPPAAGEAVHEEPPPGARYRVVVKGANVRYPEGICSHCTFSPAPGRMPVLASISRTGVGDRQIETLRIPVCEDCRARASARSEEQRTAQLQAHLIGVLVALVLIVCGLSIGFINLRENFGPALVGLIVMGGLGYVVPAVPLLLRASRLPKPADSNYVRSTLRVPGDTESTETAFEWRNKDYARRFLQANTQVAVSEVTRVRDDDA